MRGQRPFEGAKNEKTPDSNLMICPAGVDDRAVFMWNIAGTYGNCQEGAMVESARLGPSRDLGRTPKPVHPHTVHAAAKKRRHGYLPFYGWCPPQSSIDRPIVPMCMRVLRCTNR